MPKFGKKIEKGEADFFSTNRLLALRWKDKREVNMLTSIHNKAMETKKKGYRDSET